LDILRKSQRTIGLKLVTDLLASDQLDRGAVCIAQAFKVYEWEIILLSPDSRRFGYMIPIFQPRKRKNRAQG
jgi:hypothetical protein